MRLKRSILLHNIKLRTLRFKKLNLKRAGGDLDILLAHEFYPSPVIRRCSGIIITDIVCERRLGLPLRTSPP